MERISARMAEPDMQKRESNWITDQIRIMTRSKDLGIFIGVVNDIILLEQLGVP
jgi:hypothetical protein